MDIRHFSRAASERQPGPSLRIEMRDLGAARDHAGAGSGAGAGAVAEVGVGVRGGSHAAQGGGRSSRSGGGSRNSSGMSARSFRRAQLIMRHAASLQSRNNGNVNRGGRAVAGVGTGAAAANADVDAQSRQTLLTCRRFLCLRPPVAACCGSALDKGMRSLVAASLCIHGTAVLIRVIEIVLSATSAQVAPFNFVCISPSSSSVGVAVALICVRLAWIACCALTCARTRAEEARRRRNIAVTAFFFCAIFLGAAMCFETLYINILDPGCDGGGDDAGEDNGLTTAAPSGDGGGGDDSGSTGSALGGDTVTGIDIAYAMIVAIFGVLLQGYCAYAAWGYLVHSNAPPRERGNHNGRSRAGGGNPNNNGGIVMGELVDVETIQGEPVELVSLVVGLPRTPAANSSRRRRALLRTAPLRGGSGAAAAAAGAGSTVGSASASGLVLPSPVLGTGAADKGWRPPVGPVAVATMLRRASDADLSEVPEAIVVAEAAAAAAGGGRGVQTNASAREQQRGDVDESGQQQQPLTRPQQQQQQRRQQQQPQQPQQPPPAQEGPPRPPRPPLPGQRTGTHSVAANSGDSGEGGGRGEGDTDGGVGAVGAVVPVGSPPAASSAVVDNGDASGADEGTAGETLGGSSADPADPAVPDAPRAAVGDDPAGAGATPVAIAERE